MSNFSRCGNQTALFQWIGVIYSMSISHASKYLLFKNYTGTESFNNTILQWLVFKILDILLVQA